MDIMNDPEWYGRIEVYGIGTPKLFEGSIQRVVTDALIYLRGVQSKHGPNGKEVILTLRTQPMEEAKDGMDMMTRAVMAELAEGAIQEGTPEYDELMASFKPNPWTKDSMWPRFSYLQARQINFETAPDEYYRLWDYFEPLYPEHWRGMKKKSL